MALSIDNLTERDIAKNGPHVGGAGRNVLCDGTHGRHMRIRAEA
jgi:hypothetical protein